MVFIINNLDSIDLNKYQEYKFPYIFSKHIRRKKKGNFKIYYNQNEFVKIYNKVNKGLYIFLEKYKFCFNKLIPHLTHLIYEDNAVKGYIIKRGKDLSYDSYWGIGDKNVGKQIFLNFIENIKKILEVIIDDGYYYIDIKPKNVIILDGTCCFIDLENFVKISKNTKVVSKYLKSDHWYIKKINSFYT